MYRPTRFRVRSVVSSRPRCRYCRAIRCPVAHIPRFPDRGAAYRPNCISSLTDAACVRMLVRSACATCQRIFDIPSGRASAKNDVSPMYIMGQVAPFLHMAVGPFYRMWGNGEAHRVAWGP